MSKQEISDEIWKDVIGFEGLYQVSNFGNVKSLKRFGSKGGLLKSATSTSGYLCIVLSKNNKAKTINIHVLVWDHFGDKKRNGRKFCIDHKDENKLNNRIDNLQVLSQRNNLCKHYFRNGKLSGTTFFQGKWQSSIGVGRKKIYLGVYNTQQEAHAAYSNYKQANSL